MRKKTITLTILCILITAVCIPLATSHNNDQQTTPVFDNEHWWNTQWPYRKLITIDHTKVSGDLTNFPVLIHTVDPDIADAAQHNGQDIVFIKYTDNTTQLNHEIEYYNYQTGELHAWVNTPELSSIVDTKFWLYYGNSNAANQQHIEATWDANYLAVQHLEETTGTVFDSTTNNNDGTPYGSNQNVQGKIDGADYFDGIDDKIELPIVYTSQTQFTIETWIYAETGARHFISQRNDASQGVFLQITSDNTLQYYINGISHITGVLLNTWYYIALVYDGSTASLYVNTFDSSIPCTSPTWPTVPFCLGNRPAGDRAFHGTMDETRLSSIARSDCWINTAYTNQNNPVAFISLGMEEPYAYSLTLTINPPATGTIQAIPQPPYYYNTLVTLTAIPNTGYMFDYWSGDIMGNSNPANILIDEDKTVTANFITENQPPDAMDDYATVQENSTNNQITVLANDYDPDADSLTITSITQPLNGFSTHDGSYVYYTPNTGYDGIDSFKYTIDDAHGGTDTATVYLTILPQNETNKPPNQPNHPVPDDQAINISINTDLGWEGGDPDDGDIVTYDVYFGPTNPPSLLTQNHTSTIYTLGALAYNTTYYWCITAWDNHNASTAGPLWSFTTQKQQQQESSINVTITKPVDHRFYYRNLLRLPRLQKTAFVYGPITITTSVTTVNTSVDHVDFYIDGKLKKTDDTDPYNYRWTQLRSFKHIITVKAYSTDGKISTDEITVFKWRLHPILLLGAAYLFTKMC